SSSEGSRSWYRTPAPGWSLNVTCDVKDLVSVHLCDWSWNVAGDPSTVWSMKNWPNSESLTSWQTPNADVTPASVWAARMKRPSSSSRLSSGRNGEFQFVVVPGDPPIRRPPLNQPLPQRVIHTVHQRPNPHLPVRLHIP